MRRLVLFAVAVLGLVTLPLAQEDRKYHPVEIGALAADNPTHWHVAHTHVEVQGGITNLKREGDGDLQVLVWDDPSLRKMDRAHCIVVDRQNGARIRNSGRRRKAAGWDCCAEVRAVEVRQTPRTYLESVSSQ